jgi:hypothetical protein
MQYDCTSVDSLLNRILTWTQPSNVKIFFFRNNKEIVSEINADLFFVFRLTAVTPLQN